jgi:hypothetical protein
MPKKHKKPPQGTHSIEGEGRERRMQNFVAQLVTGVWAYCKIKDHPDWELIARNTPEPDAWNNLCEQFGKETVAEAHKYWAGGPENRLLATTVDINRPVDKDC